jgi:hypothetical protein
MQRIYINTLRSDIKFTILLYFPPLIIKETLITLLNFSIILGFLLISAVNSVPSPLFFIYLFIKCCFLLLLVGCDILSLPSTVDPSYSSLICAFTPSFVLLKKWEEKGITKALLAGIAYLQKEEGHNFRPLSAERHAFMDAKKRRAAKLDKSQGSLGKGKGVSYSLNTIGPEPGLPPFLPSFPKNTGKELTHVHKCLVHLALSSTFRI